MAQRFTKIWPIREKSIRTGIARENLALSNALLPAVSPKKILFLWLTTMAVFASKGRAVAQNPQTLLHLLPPPALIFSDNLLLAFVVSKWLASGYENFVGLPVNAGVNYNSQKF